MLLFVVFYSNVCCVFSDRSMKREYGDEERSSHRERDSKRSRRDEGNGGERVYFLFVLFQCIVLIVFRIATLRI